MDFDPRDIDSRDDERHGYNRDDTRWDERERDDGRERSFDPRDVFTREMNLPCGFTSRQARFLSLVMRHAGVCVPRQYASFAGMMRARRGGVLCRPWFSGSARYTQNRDVNDPGSSARRRPRRALTGSFTSRFGV